MVEDANGSDDAISDTYNENQQAYNVLAKLAGYNSM